MFVCGVQCVGVGWGWFVWGWCVTDNTNMPNTQLTCHTIVHHIIHTLTPYHTHTQNCHVIVTISYTHSKLPCQTIVGYKGKGQKAMELLRNVILDRILMRRTKVQCADVLALPPR